MAFSYRELRCFLAVVDHGSLGRASEVVHLSQPALSRVIQSLETKLHQALFERNARGMYPSSAGALLVAHARHLVSEMEVASNALAELRGLKRGTLRIGAVAAVVRSFLPAAVAELLRRTPGVEIQLVEGADDRLVHALNQREIDLAICGELDVHHDYISIAECHFDDVYSVFTANTHPLAQSNEVSIHDVLRETWIMPPAGARPREMFELAIREVGLTMPLIAVECWSPDAMIAFVAQTRMLGWLPKPLYRLQEAAGAIRSINIQELTIPRRFFVYRRSKGVLPLPANALLSSLPTI